MDTSMQRTGTAATSLAPGAHCTTAVWLGDGTPVRIRPIRRSDFELERRFVQGLSDRTRYLRLLSGRKPTAEEIARWTDIDPSRELALIAVVADDDGGEQQIGVARCALEDDAIRRFDFGIVVADAWQGRGLGEALLTSLIACAAEAGIRLLSSITLSENRRMLSLARKLGFSLRREVGDATLTRLEMRLP